MIPTARGRIGLRCGLLALWTLWSLPVCAAERMVFTPGQSLATPDGALSLSLNPAGLTTTRGWDARLQLAQGGRDGINRGAGYGLYLSSAPWGPLTLGLSSEHLMPDTATVARNEPAWYAMQRVGLGLGWKLTESVSVGAVYRLRDVGRRSWEGAWEVGTLLRPWNWLSVGVRLGALGSDLDGVSRTRMGVGVAVRPWFGTDRLTLAADAEWLLGDRLERALLSGWVKMTDGVAVGVEAASLDPQRTGATANTENRLTLAARLGFGRTGLQIGAHVPDRGELGMTVGLRVSSDVVPGLRRWESEVVRFHLRGTLTERKDDEGTHLASLLMDLDAVTEARQTRVVVLQATDLEANWAQIEEIRAVVARIRASGKKVVFFSDSLGTRALALAAACDKIVVPPLGLIAARGVATDFVGLRETLSRLGVVVEAVRFAEHKTAPEMLIADEPSAALNAQLTQAVTRSWQNFTDAVALGRGLTPTGVEAILREGAAFPEDARTAKLIDDVATWDELPGLLGKWQWTKLDTLPGPYAAPAVRTARWGAIPKIAVVEVVGSISDRQGSRGLMGSSIGGEEIAQVIRQTATGSGVRALVARIDSPGGAVLGSELMRSALVKAQESVPVVASMGGVAASGGYWTSLGAGTVFADRSSVTGSIGAFVLKPSLSGMWQKLGVHLTPYAAGPWGGISSLSREWTAEERALVSRELGRYYGTFLDLTAKRRGLTRTVVESLAGGRIWYGDEALERKLVDKGGGFLEALAVARTQAGLQPGDESAVVFVPRAGLLQRLRADLIGVVGGEEATTSTQLVKQLRTAVGPWLDAAVLDHLSAGPLAHLPPLPDARGP